MLRDFFNRLYPEVGLVGKEYLAASPLRLVPQGAVLHHEGLPFVLVRLEQPLLGPLEGKPQAVQPVQATATAQTGAESFPDKLPDSSPVPVGQLDACLLRQLLHRRLQLLPLPLVKRGGNPRTARISGPQALPRRRPTPTGRWCVGPAPAPPPSQGIGIHLPLFQISMYLSRTHHQPLSDAWKS